jgi:acyl-coenzyme A thioesterase PaaI-like protein
MDPFTPQSMLAFLRRSLPTADDFGEEVTQVEPGVVSLRLTLADRHFSHDLPEGSGRKVLSGPLIMGLADTAMYGAVHSICGAGPLAAIISLNVTFLRPAAAARLLVDGRVLRHVGQIFYAEALLRTEPERPPIAQVTASYAIWPAPAG